MRDQRGSAFVQTAVRSPAKAARTRPCEKPSRAGLAGLAEAVDLAAGPPSTEAKSKS